MNYEIGKRLLICLTLMALPMMARAEVNLTLDQVVDKLQANYDQAKTYTAAFRQEIVSPSFGRALNEGAGEIKYRKPGRMVWKYEKPELHIYILDGNTLWDYYPGEKRALHLTLDQAMVENVPKAFLFGMGKLRQEFEISFHAGRPVEADGTIKLDLAPRNDQARAALGTLIFTVDPRDFLVREVEMTDALGNLNHLWFDKVKLNAPLDAKQFQWSPPKDVKVFGVESEESESQEPKAAPKPEAPAPAGGKTAP
ncbi:MAG: hypothetical protein A2V67_04825 [Deltaproteobacteria bacterium RBG_13_61_14]|nr:MAG: hypothetical protein A2V67_04825 [Deltaproteobacteria bacterium RBG_13_61_14]